MPYEVSLLEKGLWAIRDGDVRMYLLDGGSAAFLLDTGYGSGDLRAVVSGLTGAPVTVVHTHSHEDHYGGDGQFHAFVMHEADAAGILPHCPKDAEVRYVREGDRIEGGTVCLTVLEIPGHTPGSIALLEPGRRLLFTGDAFARNFPVYMQFPGQDYRQYLQGMERLAAMEAEFDRICPCHGDLPFELCMMQDEIACCRSILNGTAVDTKARIFDGTMQRAAKYGETLIFY